MKRKVFDVEFTVDSHLVQKGADGFDVGIVKGYASTFGNRDRAGDTFAPTAFDKTIADHRARGNRGIRILFNHDRDKLLGHAPIENVRVDSRGLYIEVHLNLEVQRAKDIYSFVKQGVLRDFSVGYIEEEYSYNTETGLNTILVADLLEVSIVTEPCNQSATITEVKCVGEHTPLPMAARETEWDAEGAAKRIPADEAGKAYLWSKDGAHKFLIADVIDGILTVVPKAVFKAVSALKGIGECPEIGESDRKELIKVVSKYCATLGVNVSLGDELVVDVSDVEGLKSLQEVEELLGALAFSNTARKAFISKVRELSTTSSRDDGGESDGRDDSSKKAALEAVNSLSGFLASLTSK